MGLRIRKSIKIAPGIHINLGEKGISTSIGRRGIGVTFGKTGTSTHIGILNYKKDTILSFIDDKKDIILSFIDDKGTDKSIVITIHFARFDVNTNIYLYPKGCAL